MMVMNMRSKNARRTGTIQDDARTWNDPHAQIANPKLMYNRFVQIHANMCLRITNLHPTITDLHSLTKSMFISLNYTKIYV
jgi:hypothetical protein